MKATGFHARVEREIEIALRELDLLIHCASNHYDGTVKDAARHGRGGIFYGWRVQLLLGHEALDDEAKIAALSPETTVDLCIAFREADLACKALEFPCVGETDPAPRQSLLASFHNVLTDCNEEYTRLNQPEKTRALPWFLQPVDKIARSIWWSCGVTYDSRKKIMNIYADGFCVLSFRVRDERDDWVQFEVLTNAWSRCPESEIFAGAVPGTLWCNLS